jgi:enoyl-CoA hydratase
MDMILTGREVTAGGTQTMGLMNRIVPEREARHNAELFAAELSGFPQL